MPIIYGSAGIKLGAGGLLCAYDDTGAECLRPPIVAMSQLLGVHCDFA
jgi:putative IMPACT (imprinted ancient) family translation regulator